MDWKKVIQQAYSHAKAAGLTQNEIARRTGAHQKQISQLVTGKVEPRLGFALRFFEAVGIDLVLTARATRDGAPRESDGHKTDEK